MTTEVNQGDSATAEVAHWTKTNIFRNSSILVVRLVGGFALNALGGILLARILGPSAWGIYAISLFLLTYYQIILEKGLVAYLIQKQADLTDEEKGVSYTIQVGLGLFCFILAVFVLAPLAERLYGHGELGPLVISSGVAALTYSMRSVPLALLEREMRYFQVGLIEIADMFVFNAVAIGLVLSGLGILALVIANLTRGLVSTGAAIKLTEKPRLGWNSKAAGRILKFGVPVFGSNLLKILTSAADPILMGILAGPQALGFLQVALTLLSYPASVAGAITRVSFSALARIQDRDEDLNQLTSANILALSKIIIPAIVGLAGLAPIWVPWIYGTQWIPTTSVLWIAAIPVATGQVLLTLTASLYAKGHARGVLGFLIIYSLVYWLACLILIPHWAQLGSPLALWVTAPIWILLLWYYRKRCGVLNLKPFVLILISAVLILSGLFLSALAGWWIITTILLIGFLVWWFALSRKVVSAGIAVLAPIIQWPM